MRLSRILEWKSVCAGALLLCAAPALASNVNIFQRVHTTVPIRDLAASPAGYVAAAANGIWVSPNLTNWYQANLPAGMGLPLQSVYWTGSEFLAGGGGLISSSDGIHWTLDYSDQSNQPLINSIVYANGVYLAVGNDVNGVLLLRSTDGQTWTAEDTGLDTGGGYTFTGEGVTYGNGLYVLSAERSDYTDFILTSPDGITWTQQILPDGGLNGILEICFDGAYGNGTFVIGGVYGDYTSPDGVNWTLNVFPQTNLWFMLRIAFVNGQFVGVGRDYDANPTASAVFVSPDGVSWTKTDLAGLRENSVYEMGSVLSNGGDFVAAGYLGAWTSPDGTNWTQVYDGPQSNGYYCLGYGAGNYLMLPGANLGADSLILRSTDGASWPDTLMDVGQQIGGGGVPGCVTYGNGNFLAGGFGAGQIFYSSDGTSWNASNLPTNSHAGPVTWNGTLFVDLGFYFNGTDDVGAVFTSPDGTTWSQISYSGLPTDTLLGYSLAAANGKFFTWKYAAPPLYVSADGANWTTVTLPSAFVTLAGVAYGRGQYIAVGGDADRNVVVATSTDGINWTQEGGLPSGLSSLYTNSPTFGGGEFLIPSFDNTVQLSAFLISHDGLTWTKTIQPGNWYLQQIAWDGAKFVASSFYDIFNAPGVALDLAGRVKPIIGGGVHLKYTFRLSNDSTDGTTANDAVFSDPLPAHVAFESATASRGSCALHSGKVVCNLGNLGPGAAAGVVVQVRVTANVCSISNTAEGYAEQPVRNDASPSATVTITRPHC